MEYTIHVSKAQREFAIEFDKLPPASQQQIITYGLKQLLNDATASIKPGEAGAVEAATKAAQDRLTRLEAGTYKTGTGRTGGKRNAEDQAVIDVLTLVYARNMTKAKAAKQAQSGWDGLKEAAPANFEAARAKLAPFVEKRRREIEEAEALAGLDLGV